MGKDTGLGAESRVQRLYFIATKWPTNPRTNGASISCHSMIYNPNSFKIEINLSRPFELRKNLIASAHDYPFDCSASASSTDHKRLIAPLSIRLHKNRGVKTVLILGHNSCALISSMVAPKCISNALILPAMYVKCSTAIHLRWSKTVMAMASFSIQF